MSTFRPWPPEKRARLVELAASGMNAMDIGAEMGRSLYSILTYCGRNGIHVIKYSPEQQAVYDERAAQRQQARNVRKTAANKARLIAKRKAIAAQAATRVVPERTKMAVHELRAKFPVRQDMTKTELRAMLAEAVQNTAAMQSEASV